MMPDLEDFIHRKKFLVTDITVKFKRVENARVKSDWINFSIGVGDR